VVKYWRVQFAVMMIGVILIALLSLPAPASENDDYALQSYHTFLREQAQETPERFIVALKNYIRDHPAFERAYLQLYEHLLYYNGIDAAQSFFASLLSDPVYSRNAGWMLARLYAVRDNSNVAFDYFLKSLQSGPPSFFLLDDFLDFDHRHGDRFHALDKLEMIGLTAAQLHLARSIYYRRKLDFKKALRSLSQIPPEDENYQFALNLLGMCSFYLLNDRAALAYWREGLNLVRKNGDWQYEIHYLTNLALAETRIDNFEEAREYHEQAISRAESLRDFGRTAFANANLGDLLWSQKRPREALARYRRAFAISMRICNNNYVAVHGNGMALASLQLGDFNLALESTLKAEKYAQLAANKSIMIEVLLLKGSLYNHMNLKRLAQFEYEKAAKLADATPFEQISRKARGRLIDFWLDLGEYGKAREFYRMLLAGNVDENEKIYWQWMMAKTYFQEKKYDLAEQAYQVACERAKRRIKDTYAEYVTASVRKEIGDIRYASGRFDDALKIYQEELIHRVAQRNQDLKFDQAFAIGQVYDRLGEREKAIAYYSSAAMVSESKRSDLKVEDFRIGYFSRRSQVYNVLARCYLEEYEISKNHDDLEKLFRAIELSRARAAKDALLRRPIIAKGEPEFTEYHKACAKLAEIQKRLRANPELEDSLHIQHEIARFNVMTKRLSVQKSQSGTYDSSVVAFSDILEALKRRNLSLLLYRISNDGSFVIATNDDQVEVVRLGIKIDSLRVTIDRLLNPFHEVDEQSSQKTPFRAGLAHQLYQSLVAPVEKKLRLKQRLLIVPDLALMGLPFEMLLDQAPNAAEYTPKDAPDYAARFLLHRYAISYSPSTWLLTKPVEARPSNPRLLVLANPFRFEAPPSQLYTMLTMRAGWRFNFLWFAEEEADQIKKKHANTNIYKQREANEARLRQESAACQILHFATHAFVDTVFDAFSGLVLAAGEDSTDDGMLMGYEIADLDLPCDLITVSACETGRGKLVAGEGILGLPRLFFSAGAKSVLMTLWKVDDKFASELMPKFYDDLLNQKRPKTDALAEAKRASVMPAGKSTERGIYQQHPFYWASFVLYGEPGVGSRGFLSRPIGLVMVIIVFLILALTVASRLRNKERGFTSIQ
jgi:CHAT domain-containing protein